MHTVTTLLPGYFCIFTLLLVLLHNTQCYITQLYHCIGCNLGELVDQKTIFVLTLHAKAHCHTTLALVVAPWSTHRTVPGWFSVTAFDALVLVHAFQGLVLSLGNSCLPNSVLLAEGIDQQLLYKLCPKLVLTHCLGTHVSQVLAVC